MRRFLLLALFATACGDDNSNRIADAHVDAPADAAGSGSGSGSGSNLAATLEPSPPDHGLEIVVGMASMVVVIGPARSARRRRRAA
jgi:hypothetical protein